MDIQGKQLIITFLLLLLNAGLYLATRIIFPSNFEKFQENEAKKNILRGLESIKNINPKPNTTTIDWAFWDDTYAFVQGEYPEYEDLNLTDEIYNNYGLNKKKILLSSYNYNLNTYIINR